MRALLTFLRAANRAIRWRLLFWHHSRADHHLEQAERLEASLRAEQVQP